MNICVLILNHSLLIIPLKMCDSCHSRVIRNQQYLYPKFLLTAVVKLLKYSGLGSNTGMSFLHTNDLSEVKNGELNLDFGVLVKTVRV